MLTFIVSLNWTDQGIRSVKETTVSPSQSPRRALARDNGRTLGNVDLIGDHTASGVLAAALVIAFSTPS